MKFLLFFIFPVMVGCGEYICNVDSIVLKMRSAKCVLKVSTNDQTDSSRIIYLTVPAKKCKNLDFGDVVKVKCKVNFTDCEYKGKL